VVQGDVFGGHYYAYIRPSVGHFWEDISAVDRDVTAAIAEGPGGTGIATNTRTKTGLGGKWFKFDDEYVTEVDRRQAVEGSYGSGKEIPGARSYHSAYMLVYIREAEAASIMSRVEPPAALTARLNEEYQRSMEAKHQKVRQFFFRDVQYLLAKDLDDFGEYQGGFDFFDPEKVRTMKIMKKSSIPGFLTAFAELLSVPVDCVRLWCIEKPEDRQVVRIDHVYDLQTSIDNPLLTKGPIFMYVEVCANLHDSDCAVKMNQLKQYQEQWLVRCRQAVSAQHGPCGYDRLEGCGACRGNLPLRNYLRDDAMKEKLLHENITMNQFLVKTLLSSSAFKMQEDKTLMLVLKKLNVNILGNIETPVVMRTETVQAVDGDNTTYLHLHRYLMKSMNEDVLEQVSEGDITPEEGRAQLEMWGSGSLIRLLAPTEIERIPHNILEYPISNSTPFSLKCGDIVCLVPEPGEDESDESSSDSESVDSPYLNELVLHLRSTVLQYNMTVKPHYRIQVPHLKTINRRTGLWCQARQLLEKGKDASQEEDEDEDEKVEEGGGD
jgi:hypothetical protein